MNTSEQIYDPCLLVMCAVLIGALMAFIGVLVVRDCRGRCEMDETLRDSRLKFYKPLWTQTQLPPRWYKTEPFTYDQALNLSETLNTWYFGEGGIYLSFHARRAYEHVQKSIKEFSGMAKENAEMEDKTGSDSDSSDTEDDAVRKRQRQVELKDRYEVIRKSCGHLRSELTKDVLVRSKIFRPN